MTLGTTRRRRRRRSAGLLRWLVGGLGAAVLFGAGVAVGQALEDRPEAGKPVTRVATIQPWTQTNRVTVTVTTP